LSNAKGHIEMYILFVLEKESVWSRMGKMGSILQIPYHI